MPSPILLRHSLTALLALTLLAAAPLASPAITDCP